MPARVDYVLTPLGQSLMPVIHAATQWAEHHIDQVSAAQVSYDTRSG